MSAIVVSVHDVVTGSSVGAGRVAHARPPGQGEMGMDYRIAWAAGETMERLFSNISLLGPIANRRVIDGINIHGVALAANFLRECRTDAGQRSLRGIVNRCLKPRHVIHLVVPHSWFQSLMANGRDFQTYTPIFQSTGATVHFGSRIGEQFSFMPAQRRSS